MIFDFCHFHVRLIYFIRNKFKKLSRAKKFYLCSFIRAELSLFQSGEKAVVKRQWAVGNSKKAIVKREKAMGSSERSLFLIQKC